MSFTLQISLNINACRFLVCHVIERMEANNMYGMNDQLHLAFARLSGCYDGREPQNNGDCTPTVNKKL